MKIQSRSSAPLVAFKPFAILLALLLALTVTSIIAAGQSPNGSSYTDNVLPITLTIPEGWNLFVEGSKPETRTIILEGIVTVSGAEQEQLSIKRQIRAEISIEPYSIPENVELINWLGSWSANEMSVSQTGYSYHNLPIVERIEHPFGETNQVALITFVQYKEKVLRVTMYGGNLKTYPSLINQILDNIIFHSDLSSLPFVNQQSLDAVRKEPASSSVNIANYTYDPFAMPLGARHAMDVYPYNSNVDCRYLGCYWISQGPNGTYSHDHASTSGAIDFLADEGTNVYASRGGTVLIAGKPASGYTGFGNIVLIEHSDGITTMYAHLSEWNTQILGKWVDKGTYIGKTGITGWQEFGLKKPWAPHLHFQARIGDSIFDRPASIDNIQGVTWNDSDHNTGYAYGPPVLYENANFNINAEGKYEGKAQAFPESVPSLLIQEYSNGLGNDRASSLDWVYPWSFRMYVHNDYDLPGFRGESDISDFAYHRFGDGTLLNDNVSSVVVAYGMCEKPGIGPINYSSLIQIGDLSAQATSDCNPVPSAPPMEAVWLLSPSNGQALSSQTVQFSWTISPEAYLEGYQLLVKTTTDMNSGGTEILNTFTTNSSPTFTLSSYSGALYWAVRPRVNGSYGPWSNIYSFGFNKTVPTPDPQPSPPASGWNQVFFRDNTLGSQCGTRTETDVYMFRDSDGGWSPPSGCPSYDSAWSVRMDRYDTYFQGGDYLFGMFYDDAARLYIDDVLRIDGWTGSQHYEGYYISPGNHHLRLEYKNNAGHAIIQLWWQGPGALPSNNQTQDPQQWWASYWGNRNQWEDSVGRRNEGTGFLDHNWGDGSPGFGLPSDQFSTRYERTVFFSCGTYNFQLSSDDGSRLWIDNNLIPEFNHWVTNVWSTQLNIPLTAGNHKIQVDHFENGGGASIHFSWNLVNECPVLPEVTPNPAPFLRSLSPYDTYAGSGDLNLIANGNSFVQGGMIIWDGQPLTTNFIDSSRLSAIVPYANLKTPGEHTVFIQNPAPGGGNSAPTSFSTMSMEPWSMYRHDPAHTGRSTATTLQKPGIVWQYPTGDSESQPVISPEGRIYIGHGNHLDALSMKGEKSWSFTADDKVRSPLVYQNKIYFGTNSGRFYALDAAGNQLWIYQTGSWIFSAPAVAPDGTVYVGSSDGYLYAFSPAGQLKWRFEVGSWINSSPAIGKDGTIYFGSTTGSAYAVTSNGSLKWSFATGSYIDCSPVLGADGTVYLGSWDGNFYALNGQSGLMKWAYATGEVGGSSPAIDSTGNLYVATVNSGLYALTSSGSLIWHFTADQDSLSSPVLTKDGVLYVSTHSGNLYGIYTATGGIKWSLPLGGWLENGPVIDLVGQILVANRDQLFKIGSISKIYLPFINRP